MSEGAPLCGPADALAALRALVPGRRAAILEAVEARGGDRAAARSLVDALVPAAAPDGWDAYLEDLRAAGERLAEAGVGFAAWLGVVGIVRDLTRETRTPGLDACVDAMVATIGEAYVAAKERLRSRTEAHYRMMFERSPLPMWMFDRDTLRFIAVNDAAVRRYGYAREEFERMTIADIRTADDHAALREDLARAHGPSSRTLWKHRTRRGEILHVEISADDVELDGRRLRLVLAHDATEREVAKARLREAEDRLRELQKAEAIGRLADCVAHDFNNVLTVIESYATLLEDALAGDARQADAGEIRRAAERGGAITGRLLTLGRRGHSRSRPLDLDALVASHAEILRRIVGPTTTIDVRAGGTPRVLADPDQLEQVVMNLVLNARDAMPRGGRVSLATAAVELDARAAAATGVAAGRYVVLGVDDNGCGMDAATLGRIFDPYFTTKPRGKGTGLGLAIARGIVGQAGGTITVDSEPGRGTSFRVYLPVATDAADAAEPPAIAAPSALPPITLIVVDADASVRQVAVRILRDAGCHVLEAADVEDALEVAVAHDGAIELALIDGDRAEDLPPRLHALRPGTRTVVAPKPYSPELLRAAVAAAIDAPAAPPPARAAPRARRVLVVEDDPVQLEAIARALRAAGDEVVVAGDASGGLRRVEPSAFDVIVTDMHLPDGDGIDLLRAVRRVDLDVPIVLITGTPSLDAAVRAIEHGAFRFLPKPLDLDALGQVVRHAARVHALARLRREASSLRGVDPGAVDRAGLEVRFEAAIEGLWVAFQPIVDARTGARYGVEALVRTSAAAMDTRRLLDTAHALDAMPQLGQRVRAIAAATVAPVDGLHLFVNLHPDELADAQLVDPAAPLSALAPRVVLEITERAALASSVELTARLHRLREMGFRLALDDIGAGYSGLATFTEVMPEVVKIDMALVRDCHRSLVRRRTIAAVAALCHEVGALVVGEGVETPDEQACLVDLGCDLLQGYLLGRPGRL